MKLFLALVFFATPAFAIDSKKCSDMLNNGMFKKYSWQGMGDSNLNAITAETKRAGSFSATTNVSVESSTAISDPGYSTNLSVSETQSSSSFGPCSLFALERRRTQRELYVAQNFEQVKKDIANGSGDHLATLAWFSLCDDASLPALGQALQQGFKELQRQDAAALPSGIDRVIRESSALKRSCADLSTI